MPVAPTSLSNLRPPWQPGESGRPNRTIGATLRQWLNVLGDMDLSTQAVQVIADDPTEPWPKRFAAQRILRGMRKADLADFEPLVEGKKSLAQLRTEGVDTTALKRVKPVKGAKGLEVELHGDAGGEEFDRVVEQTDGAPTKKIEVKDATVTQDLGELAERLAEMGWEPATMPAMLQAALSKRRAKVVESTVVET